MNILGQIIEALFPDPQVENNRRVEADYKRRYDKLKRDMPTWDHERIRREVLNDMSDVNSGGDNGNRQGRPRSTKPF